jgi:hypothetical protein
MEHKKKQKTQSVTYLQVFPGNKRRDYAEDVEVSIPRCQMQGISRVKPSILKFSKENGESEKRSRQDRENGLSSDLH